MYLRIYFLAGIIFLFTGCHRAQKQLNQSVDDLVFRKATKAQVVQEFGAPVSTSADGKKETMVFVPVAKTSRKAVIRVVNGVETKEELISSTPGKLKVTMTFLDGVAASGIVSPAR